MKLRMMVVARRGPILSHPAKYACTYFTLPSYFLHINIYILSVMNISPVLPLDREYSVLHMRTNAYQCKSLKITRKKPLTLKVKHLLLLSENDTNRIILGIEVYVYLTFTDSILERHIFISKADSTGLGTRMFSAAGVVRCFLEYLINIDPKAYLAGATYRKAAKELETGNHDNGAGSNVIPLQDAKNENTHDLQIVNDLRVLSEELKRDPSTLRRYTKNATETKTTLESKLPVRMPDKLTTNISLFTRAADSYLFPKSEKNSAKRVVNGKTLFKWWISILDRTLDESWVCKADIPGSDRVEINRFIPQGQNWQIGNIYVTSGRKGRAVHTIPLFPDDPKGRFLEHLIVENRYRAVNASSFWEELGFRQEFRLGSVVGIIGCSKKTSSIDGTQEDPNTTIMNLSQYKKIRELVKGEDYGNPNDIVEVWSSGLRETASISGVSLKFMSIKGSATPKFVPSDKDSQASRSPAINTLTGKRKTPTVNNLSSLVKRKKL
ncbi:hypothetical protein OY671_000314 [Metschnikowia pulcherrima]|nr:hypothetical protein OY671_000314 [Metschnikowia pulcherrima]